MDLFIRELSKIRGCLSIIRKLLSSSAQAPARAGLSYALFGMPHARMVAELQ